MSSITMKFSEYRKEIERQKKNSPSSYFKDDTFFLGEISNAITELRVRKNLTQEQLANMIGTKQSGVARIEAGNQFPSVKFLKKIADALDTYLIINFAENENKNKYTASYTNSNPVDTAHLSTWYQPHKKQQQEYA